MNKKTKLQVSGIVIGFIILGGLTYINIKQDNFVRHEYEQQHGKMIEESSHVIHAGVSQAKIDEIQKRVDAIPQECIDSNDECDRDSVSESDVRAARRTQKYPPREDIRPYDKTLLPVMPDSKENNATVLGIDSNQNGVRDDQEHRIVEYFGEDTELVEAMFAGQRVFQKSLEYAQKEQFDEETLKEVQYESSMFVACYWDLFHTSSQYYDPRIDNLDKIFSLIGQTNVNTYERVQLERKIGRQFHGKVAPNVYPTLEECRQFITSILTSQN